MTQPPPQPGGPYYGPPPGPGYGPPPPGYPVYGPPPYGWPAPPPALSPGGRPLADFGTRLVATLIDGAILGVVALIFAIPLFYSVFSQMEKATETIDPVTGEVDPAQFFGNFGHLLLLELGFTVAMLIVYYIYYVEMLWRSGQSVGKRVMKIQIIPIDPTARLTRGMVALRYLIEFVAGVFVPLLPYLDGFWQLWDKPYQQTLHDKAARTVVIKVSP